ncbi:MAG: hypothetical protein JXB46_02825 [Candidatus Eisenbacteria bacterium]|nr:hypothetical protein [Candidatus Eisenbacteria bacterium]
MTRGPCPSLRWVGILACLVVLCIAEVGCDDVELIAPTDPGSLTNLSISGYYRRYPAGMPPGTISCRTTVRRSDGDNEYVAGLTLRVGDQLLEEAEAGVYEGDFMDIVGGEDVRFVLTNSVDSLVLRTELPYVATDVLLVGDIWDFQTYADTTGCNTIRWANPDTVSGTNWVSVYALDEAGDRLRSAYLYPGIPSNQLVVCNGGFSGDGDLRDAETVRVQVAWERSVSVSNPPYGTSCTFAFGSVAWAEFDVAQMAGAGSETARQLTNETFLAGGYHVLKGLHRDEDVVSSQRR